MKQMVKFLCAIAICLVALPIHADYANDFCCTCNPCECQYEWFLSSESLIFNTCEDGLPIGTQVDTIPSTDGITQVDSRVKSFHPNWDMGFRLGAGFSNPCNCWGAEIFWTNFSTHSHRHLTNQSSFTAEGSPISFFRPAWGNALFFFSSSALNDTEARWKLNLNILDLQVGRSFHISECISLRPIVGVRAAWINQSFRMTNISNNPVSGNPIVLQDLHMRSNYEGVGIKSGLESEWELGCGFHIYGSVAGSILYGRFDNKTNNVIRPFNTPESPVFDVPQKEQMCACRGVTDSAIGFCWKHDFCDNLFTCFIQLGWEHHLFIDQNKFSDGAGRRPDLLGPVVGKADQRNRGDLCLQGIVLTTKFEF